MQAFKEFWLKSFQRKYVEGDRANAVMAALIITIIIVVSLPQLPGYLSIPGLGIVALPIIFAATLLERCYKIPFSATSLAMAIPMGILGSNIGLVQMFVAYEAIDIEVRNVSASTAVMLLTIFYGLVLCVIGFATHTDEESYLELPRISLKIFLFLFVGIFGLVIFSLVQGASLENYFSAKPLVLCLGLPAAFYFTSKKRGISECIADSSIAAVVLSIMIGLIQLYGNFGADPNFEYMEASRFLELANYANFGMLYGSGLYIFSFILSLYTKQFHLINFKLKNWHLIEAFSFYVFMTLAAPSLFELV